MDIGAAIVALVFAHKWIPLGALAIGAVVRLLKSDTPLSTVPALWRPWLATGLGIVGGALGGLATGMPLQEALLQGLAAATTAMSGHDLIIESARGGREFFTKTPDLPTSKPDDPPKSDDDDAPTLTRTP